MGGVRLRYRCVSMRSSPEERSDIFRVCEIAGNTMVLFMALQRRLRQTRMPNHVCTCRREAVGYRTANIAIRASNEDPLVLEVHQISSIDLVGTSVGVGRCPLRMGEPIEAQSFQTADLA